MHQVGLAAQSASSLSPCIGHGDDNGQQYDWVAHSEDEAVVKVEGAKQAIEAQPLQTREGRLTDLEYIAGGRVFTLITCRFTTAPTAFHTLVREMGHGTEGMFTLTVVITSQSKRQR